MCKSKFFALLFAVSLIAFNNNCSSDSDDPTLTTNPGTTNPPTTTDPAKVFVSSVKASPTDQESITIKNNSGSLQDVSNWKLGDKNDPNAYTIPSSTTLTNGQSKTFSHTTLGFQINDNDEIIYLKNSLGSEIDRWAN